MYEPLKIDFEIPEELQYDIDRFLDHLNNGDGKLEDCYRTEIQCALNWCVRERLLSDEQITLLRDYYQHKGIYEIYGNPWKKKEKQTKPEKNDTDGKDENPER